MFQTKDIFVTRFTSRKAKAKKWFQKVVSKIKCIFVGKEQLYV